MSDESTGRPRRAMPASEDDLDALGDAADDIAPTRGANDTAPTRGAEGPAPTDATGAARRSTARRGVEEPGEAGHPGAGPAAEADPDPDTHAPFRRPNSPLGGSPSSHGGTLGQRRGRRVADEAVHGSPSHRAGRRMSAALPDLDEPPVAPRRSATTPSSPPEPGPDGGDRSASRASGTSAPTGGSSERSANPAPTPASPTTSGAPVLPDSSGARTASSGARASHSQDDELSVGHRHRWVLVALVAALLVAVVVTAVSLVRRQPVPVADESATARPTASVTGPRISSAGLLTLAEARTLAPDLTWAVASTTDQVPQDSPDAVSCIVRDDSHPHSIATWQRTFTTTAKTSTAALDRMDQYADEATAKKAYAAEASSLAACNAVPTRIVSAATLTGAGDQSEALTIAYQGIRTQYRTVVLMRVGTVIHALDAANYDSAVPTDKAATALAKAARRSCDVSGGSCPATTVKVTPAVPPASGKKGWLITSDLPRITPDQGEWSSAGITPVTSKGTQCEGVTLATASGPTSRNQRTYLLYKDAAAPQSFGVDEVRLTFPDAKAAAKFASTMRSSLASCSKTLETAKVTKSPAYRGTGQDGAAIEGQSFLVSQDTGGKDPLLFQVSVATVDDQVVYLLANPSSKFRFSDADWKDLTLRAAQRASQAG